MAEVKVASVKALADQARRNILGLNAAKLFNLPVKRLRPRAASVMANRSAHRQ